MKVTLDVGHVEDQEFLATADGAVWQTLTTSTIARIDTATNTFTEVLDLAAADKPPASPPARPLWAGDYGRRNVLRIDQ